MMAAPPVVPVMSEADLQRAILDLAAVMRLLVFHDFDSRRNRAGFPDLVIVGPGGVAYRELKTTIGTVSGEQETWLTALGRAGADAAVWRPQDWPHRVKAELDKLRKGTR